MSGSRGSGRPAPDVETVTAPVERRIVAAGSKSERETTVAIVDDRPLVLRRRGAGASTIRPTSPRWRAGPSASPARGSRRSSWWTTPSPSREGRRAPTSAEDDAADGDVAAVECQLSKRRVAEADGVGQVVDDGGEQDEVPGDAGADSTSK